VHVCFELANALGGEGVRDGFALAGVLCAVAGVEETALDGDECVIVVPLKDQMKTSIRGRVRAYDFRKPFP
jgi:hypothetical protein